MNSKEKHMYELWEEVQLPGFNNIKLRGLGLKEAIIGEINSFLIKLPTETPIKILLIKPREGATNISLEIVPGIGFRGDYVVYSSGDYYIKIIINHKEMPTIRVYADENQEYEHSLKNSIKYLLERKEYFSKINHEMLTQNYGIEIDSEKVGQLFGKKFQHYYVNLENNVKKAMDYMRSTMDALSKLPATIPNQGRQSLPHESTGRNNSSLINNVFPTETSRGSDTDNNQESRSSRESDNSAVSSQSKKRKRSETEVNYGLSKRNKRESYETSNLTDDSSIETMRHESDEDMIENPIISEKNEAAENAPQNTINMDLTLSEETEPNQLPEADDQDSLHASAEMAKISVLSNDNQVIVGNDSTEVLSNHPPGSASNDIAETVDPVSNELAKLVRNDNAELASNQDAEIVANNDGEIIANDDDEIIAHVDVENIDNDDGEIGDDGNAEIIVNDDADIANDGANANAVVPDNADAVLGNNADAVHGANIQIQNIQAADGLQDNEDDEDDEAVKQIEFMKTSRQLKGLLLNSFAEDDIKDVSKEMKSNNNRTSTTKRYGLRAKINKPLRFQY